MKRREHYVTCGQMKLLEQRADEAGLSYYQMMENAGTRAAEFILCKAPFAGFAMSSGTSGEEAGEVLKVAEGGPAGSWDNKPGGIAYLFCGKGNNGGDGFVVARLLIKAGWKVTVILVDGEPKTPDSITNFELLAELPVEIKNLAANNRALMELKEIPDMIVDAIYGTGLKGKLRGNGLKAAIYINKIGKLAAEENAEKKTVIFALDIPSGIGGDVTREKDVDKAAVHADYTVTFHAKKPVHLQSFASEYCGEIFVADIGIDEEPLMRVDIYEED